MKSFSKLFSKAEKWFVFLTPTRQKLKILQSIFLDEKYMHTLLLTKTLSITVPTFIPFVAVLRKKTNFTYFRALKIISKNQRNENFPNLKKLQY